MSQLPDQAVEEFRELWKRQYGVDLPEDRARVRAQEVFDVLRLVLTKPSDRQKETSLEPIPQDNSAISSDLLHSMRTTISIEAE